MIKLTNCLEEQFSDCSFFECIFGMTFCAEAESFYNGLVAKKVIINHKEHKEDIAC